jgi:rhodanese-related sulfurtransferase
MPDPTLPPFNNADMIVPRIWLGNKIASMDESFLRQNGIETVFNCTKDLPFHSSMRRRYRVPVDDNLEEEEIRNMELWSFEIIYKLLLEYKQGNTILVHCAAGMQRSAAVVAMFLMVFSGMKHEDAMQYIKERRPIAFYKNANFLKSIQGFEKNIAGVLMV